MSVVLSIVNRNNEIFEFLQKHIKTILSDFKDSDKYLRNLMELYSK